MPPPEPFSSTGVRGLLDRGGGGRDGLVLAHGAGSDCRARLLAEVAGVFAAAGCQVLRVDLPFRVRRPKGPPRPAEADADREGLRRAVIAMRGLAPGRVFLGGHSYGGRQASILASQEPELAAALLLLSYPLHPPGHPGKLRTAHFPNLRTPTLFVQGERDPFAAPEELQAAAALIPAPHRLVFTPGGHDLAAFSSAAQTTLTALLVGFHPIGS